MKRALGWLEKLRNHEKGNALAIAAAAMPLVLGGTAMAVDTIQLSVAKRQLQRAADSSAIAGARALAQGVDEADAVHHDLDENVFPILAQPETVVVGPHAGFNQAVRVTLVSEREMPFVSFFRSGPITLTAEAAAAVVNDGTFCMLALYDGTSEAGINANGNANVNLGCGMATNSRNSDAVTAGGSSSITASPIAAVGGLDGQGNNFVSPTTLLPYSMPQVDPFSDVPNPTPPGSCSGSLNVGNHDTLLIDGTNNCFTSWDIKGTLQLQGGQTYYVNGGDLTLHGRIESVGTGGVTIVMTGPGGEAGDFKQNGGGELDIDASESGDFAGIAFYRDRRASTITVKINGGADTDIRGAVYMPSTDIWFGGNAVTNASCLQMVGRILTFRGGASITNNCPPGSASQAFERTVVRLIG